MNWELIREKDSIRTYRHKNTGTEVQTKHIVTDPDGKKWFGFVDLYKIPIQRMFMAQHITSLYTIGLTLKDIESWCEQEKALLRSNDPEKYEKLYALILEKQKIAKATADPVRQHMALCTVYVIADEERIDYFDEQIAEQKIKEWMPFPEMVAFFLSWHNSHIQRYTKVLDKISTTALNLKAKEEGLTAQFKP